MPDEWVPYTGRFFFPLVIEGNPDNYAPVSFTTQSSLTRATSNLVTCSVLASPPRNWSGGYELGVMNVNWQTPLRVQ